MSAVATGDEGGLGGLLRSVGPPQAPRHPRAMVLKANKLRGPLDRDATQVGLQYLNALSKRTAIYADWGRVKNHNGAAYALSGATTQAGLDASGNSSALHLGVRHAF